MKPIRFSSLLIIGCCALAFGRVAMPILQSAEPEATDAANDSPYPTGAEQTDAPKSPNNPKPGPTRINSIGMKLVLIPPGEFVMGSPRTELHRLKSESQHRVQITKPFEIGAYEVTQAEYEAVMGRNPSPFSPQGRYKDKIQGLGTSQLPVSSISWEDAHEFCNKLSKLENCTYRLPTEAEWEYACRAGSKEAFHFGPSNDGKLANCSGRLPYGTETPGPSLDRPTSVGSFPPNAFGLFDMHGNVPEYCADWFEYDYYNHSPAKDPKGPAKSPIDMRVVRGGGWNYAAEGCRSAKRDYYMAWDRGSVIGFRVVAHRDD